MFGKGKSQKQNQKEIETKNQHIQKLKMLFLKGLEIKEQKS